MEARSPSPPELKVRGGDPKDPTRRPTNAQALSRSIVAALEGSDVVLLKSIGASALAKAMEGYRLARLEYARTSAEGRRLVLEQTEYKADDGAAWGVCSRVFSLSREHAR